MEGLRAGTKLNKMHVNWRKMPMKVKYATQTLPNSVADAIDFGVKTSTYPNFKDQKQQLNLLDCLTPFLTFLTLETFCAISTRYLCDHKQKSTGSLY